MSQFILKLFRRKSAINSLAVSVEDGISAGHSGLSRLCAGVHPHKTDETHDKEHRSKPAANEPRPQYHPHDKFHGKTYVRMLYVLPCDELQWSTALKVLGCIGDKQPKS